MAEGSLVRTLLVDDEPLALANLRQALRGHDAIEIVGEATDGVDALRLIDEVKPHLVFLDIQMPGKGGLDVARELQEGDPPVIVFVTAFDQHAVHAFEVHALDYLLKPFDDMRLADCVERAVASVRDRRTAGLRDSLQAMLRELAPGIPVSESDDDAEGYAQRILVRENENMFFIRCEDVAWFQSAGNYVRVFQKERQHLIRTTLGALEQRLNPRQFTRVHRSSIVNLRWIHHIEPWYGGDYVAVLENGQKVRVSRTYRDRLLRLVS